MFVLSEQFILKPRADPTLATQGETNTKLINIDTSTNLYTNILTEIKIIIVFKQNVPISQKYTSVKLAAQPDGFGFVGNRPFTVPENVYSALS